MLNSTNILMFSRFVVIVLHPYFFAQQVVKYQRGFDHYFKMLGFCHQRPVKATEWKPLIRKDFPQFGPALNSQQWKIVPSAEISSPG